MPIIVTASSEDRYLVLAAEVVRFQTSVKRARSGQVYEKGPLLSCFALRLVPAAGRVATVEVERGSRVAVNHVKIKTARSFSAEFGNGTLNFELYFSPTTETLEPLTPPHDYKPDVTLNDEDAID